MKNRKNRKIWFVYGDREATLLIICRVIFAVLFFFLFVGCAPTKKTLKQTITAQSEQINVLNASLEKQKLTLQNTIKEKDSTSAAAVIWQGKFESSESQNKSLLENSFTNLWYKNYYESGALKSEGGQTTEQTTQTAENQQKEQTIDYKEEYETLLSNSKRELNLLLDYVNENDSLLQVIGNSEQVQIDTTTTAKIGLSWWQKTQIIGFWVLIAGVSLVLGYRKFMKG